MPAEFPSGCRPSICLLGGARAECVHICRRRHCRSASLSAINCRRLRRSIVASSAAVIYCRSCCVAAAVS
eukprot:scaffold216_cov59-Cyclotella_meneghiniana.AAC.1